MPIDWISTSEKVPSDRRYVLVWGRVRYIGINGNPEGQFLGSSRFNPSEHGAQFDAEYGGRFVTKEVTHWAEIIGPPYTAPRPPPRKP